MVTPSAPTCAAFQVLADPMLMRDIASYQAGVPLVLYQLWVTHNSFVTRYWHRSRIQNGLPGFLALIVNHGTVRMVELAKNISFFVVDPQNKNGDQWVKLSQEQMNQIPFHAVKCNKPSMIEWAIANLPMDETQEQKVWELALRWITEDDTRVVDTLRRWLPISDTALYALLPWLSTPESWGVQQLRVIQWLEKTVVGFKLRKYCTFTLAVQVGNLSLVRYLLESRPRPTNDPIQLQLPPIIRRIHRELYSRHYEVLMYLFEHHRACLSQDVVKQMIESDDPKVMETIQPFRDIYQDFILEVAANAAVGLDAPSRLERLLDSGLLIKGVALVSIDRSAAWNQLQVIRLLHGYGIATATTDAMDVAAEKGHWTVVQFLDANRTEGFTTRMMDQVAIQLGDFQFLDENRKIGCTSRALDHVAGYRSLRLVALLHQITIDGWTTKAMDNAAGCGHLHIVQFLHGHRGDEGCCTTAAMDQAAQNGHFAVVQFLATHRSEGCTEAAIRGALRGGYLDIVRLLYTKYPQLFTVPQVLHDVLLFNAVDILNQLQAAASDDAERVDLAAVVEEAGQLMQLPTIRHIIHTLGHHELACKAIDGATHSVRMGKAGVEWVATVRAAVDKGQDPMTTATAQLRQLLLSESSGRDEKQRLVTEALLLDPRTSSWVAPHAFAQSHSIGFLNPFQVPSTLASLAVARRDQKLLDVLLDLSRVVVTATSMALEGQEGLFSFAGARGAAIRNGDLAMLQWLCSHDIPLAMEPTLLDDAIFYHQREIAEWLATHHIQACHEFDPSSKAKIPWTDRDGIDEELLDWLESTQSIRALVDFGAMACYAAQDGNLKVLKRLHKTYPGLLAPLYDQLMLCVRAGREDLVDLVGFLKNIQQ